MTRADAIAKINAHPELSAREYRGAVQVDMHGKYAGYVSDADLGSLGYSATGWGRNLFRGAAKVHRALAASSCRE